MLATQKMPERYVAWNRRWHAPQGPDGKTYLPISVHRALWRTKALGPFVWQVNSSTRAFEYPWAFFEADLREGQRVLEIGGGMSGLQFVLAKAGADVVNVDPLVSYGGQFDYTGDPVGHHRKLNQVWKTHVQLVPSTLDKAGLGTEEFDVVICISTLEHLAEDEIRLALREVDRVLKPGGRFILTVDLFLNLDPFTDRTENRWGRNVSVRWIVEKSGLELQCGERAQLCGYPEFDPRSILSCLDEYAIGVGYPQLAQAFVLRKAPRELASC